MKYLAVRNFNEFQHYRDRNPVWIKLYNRVMDDDAFLALSDAARSHLMLIWLLASRRNNKIPNDAKLVARAIQASGRVNLQELVAADFLIPWQESPAEVSAEASPYDSNLLARSEQTASPEREGELETEGEAEQHDSGGDRASEPERTPAKPLHFRPPSGPVVSTRASESDSLARERELLARAPASAPVITEFLAQFSGVRRMTWVGRLHAMFDAPPHFTDQELSVGLGDFCAMLDKSQQGPIALRAFCQRARDDAARPPETRGAATNGRGRDRPTSGADDARVWAELLDVVEKLRGHRMSADEFTALPKPMRTALRHVGGWQAVAETPADRLHHVRREFLRVFRDTERAA